MKKKFNVNTIDKKIIEVDGKIIKELKISKAPFWFTAFEKKIDDKFEKIESILEEQWWHS